MTNRTAMFLMFVLLAFFAMPAGQGDFGIQSALAQEGKEDPNAPKPEFEYLQMNPLTLPIITERGLTQQLSMVVSLELPYGTKDTVKAMEPRLADAYLQDLYGALGAGESMMQGGIVDVQAVKQRLSSVTEKVLGPEKVHDVLLQVVHQRPM